MDQPLQCRGGVGGGGEGRDAAVLLIPVVGILTPPDIPVNGVELSFPILFFFNPFLMGGNSCNKVTHRNSSNFLEYSGIH